MMNLLSRGILTNYHHIASIASKGNIATIGNGFHNAHLISINNLRAGISYFAVNGVSYSRQFYGNKNIGLGLKIIPQKAFLKLLPNLIHRIAQNIHFAQTWYANISVVVHHKTVIVQTFLTGGIWVGVTYWVKDSHRFLVQRLDADTQQIIY